MDVQIIIKPKSHPPKPGPRLTIGPFDKLGVSFTMPSQVTAPNGATGQAKLVPVPDGAAFAGTPTIVSSDPSIVSVSDNGDGTATLTVSGAEGQVCTITGTDLGNGFTDTCDITVGASGPPAETGVSLTVTF